MNHSYQYQTAWLLVGEEKTCKENEGVTIVPNEKFSTIVDCATACKAKLQNTMFAFETSVGCGATGCACSCIEAVDNDCATVDEKGFSLYKFRGDKKGTFSLIHA